MEGKSLLPPQYIQNRIFTIRGMQMMIDRDLAEMYGVETKNLNRAVNRNKDRFPEKFRFQLTVIEWGNLRLQIETSKMGDSLRFQFGTLKKGRGKHRKYLPYVFTEQGVSMLSAVLKSDTAVKVSVLIMNTFVEMRKFLSENASVFYRLDNIEQKQSLYQIESDNKFERLFKALEDKSIKPKQGVFYDGQIYDAYIFISDLIRSSKKSIVLIDNYIDDTVLTFLTKRNKNSSATIYTKEISMQLSLDLKKHNTQYPSIKIIEFRNAHDRFIIIDDKTIYHLGASLKDLGKKWFAFSKMDIAAIEMLNKLDVNG